MTPTLTAIKADFPILQRIVNGHRLVYLDSAATAQKPQVVIDAIVRYYSEYNANVFRSGHSLGEEATAAYEKARATLAHFIGAAKPEEVIFTRGATEGLNLVATSWGGKFLRPGDGIVITAMEHHSNLVPWQEVAKRTGARLHYIELNPDGTLPLDRAAAAITHGTRLVAITAASNVLGTVVPVRAIADMAHAVGALLLVDGAQSVPHQPTDVAALGADFLAFSGHKMCAPTGIGVLWAHQDLLNSMDPMLYGGEMISYVGRDEATWAEVPHKFEGGTPNIEGAIGLGVAADYLTGIGMEWIRDHGRHLGTTAYDTLQAIPGITVYGPRERGALVAFNVDGVHPHDVAQVLDAEGIAVRAGHHCAQPLMRTMDVAATVRASFYLYNDDSDVARLAEGLEHVKRYFKR